MLRSIPKKIKKILSGDGERRSERRSDRRAEIKTFIKENAPSHQPTPMPPRQSMPVPPRPSSTVFQPIVRAEPPRDALSVKDLESWQALIDRLRDVEVIKRVGINEGWVINPLSKILRDTDKYEASPPNEFDSDEIARKVCSILKRLIPMLDTCYRSENKYRNLIDAIEKAYFKGLHVTQAKNPSTGREFRADDDFEDWVCLDLDRESVIPQKTFDKNLRGKIKGVILQPYTLHYINDDGEASALHFGGQCIAYSYKRS